METEEAFLSSSILSLREQIVVAQAQLARFELRLSAIRGGSGQATPQPGRAPTGSNSLIRGLVSKKKCRFQQDGFDLDLSYITPRIIAMGLPAWGSAAFYRNPREQVQKFFKQYHAGQECVYNLCIESPYEGKQFFTEYGYFPGADHFPPPFATMVFQL
jgi:hypothetical protein